MAKLRTHNRRARQRYIPFGYYRGKRQTMKRGRLMWRTKSKEEILEDMRTFFHAEQTRESSRARDPGLATGGIGVMTHV